MVWRLFDGLGQFARCIAADQFEPVEPPRVKPVLAYSRKERLVGSPLADAGSGPFQQRLLLTGYTWQRNLRDVVTMSTTANLPTKSG